MSAKTKTYYLNAVINSVLSQRATFCLKSRVTLHFTRAWLTYVGCGFSPAKIEITSKSLLQTISWAKCPAYRDLWRGYSVKQNTSLRPALLRYQHNVNKSQDAQHGCLHRHDNANSAHTWYESKESL